MPSPASPSESSPDKSEFPASVPSSCPPARTFDEAPSPVALEQSDRSSACFLTTARAIAPARLRSYSVTSSCFDRNDATLDASVTTPDESTMSEKYQWHPGRLDRAGSVRPLGQGDQPHLRKRRKEGVLVDRSLAYRLAGVELNVDVPSGIVEDVEDESLLISQRPQRFAVVFDSAAAPLEELEEPGCHIPR